MIMKTKTSDYNQIRIDLIRAMLTHVPFDGWTWEAMEQGAIDIGFEKKKTSTSRMKIFKDLFKNGSIDFIEIFSEIIDLEVKEKYDLLEFKPERVSEKIKKIIMIRLNLCQKYKEAVRTSISLTAMIEKNNLTACQFHPEKSGNVGQSLLYRWIQTI